MAWRSEFDKAAGVIIEHILDNVRRRRQGDLADATITLMDAIHRLFDDRLDLIFDELTHLNKRVAKLEQGQKGEEQAT